MLMVVAVSFLAAGAVLALLLAGHPRASRAAALFCSAAGCLTGLIPAFFVLSGGELTPVRIPWPVPMGELSLALDPLSAFFLLPIFVVGLAGGVYGEGYLAASRGHLPEAAVRFFYFILTASMAVIVCARNAMLFLAAWEVMALASFFLVCAQDRDPKVRRAGLIYLLCTHLGTLCLFVFFARMGSRAGSMDFSAMKAAMPGPGPGLAAVTQQVGEARVGLCGFAKQQDHPTHRLYQLRAGGRRDGFDQLATLVAFRYGYPDLDQLVLGQCALDFRPDRIGEPLAGYGHGRRQPVTDAAQMFFAVAVQAHVIGSAGGGDCSRRDHGEIEEQQ